jgi:bifunctional DNA-binding transcriptional regulator/antitoxin component of YhaV-PrlF toxin-antitoxin module
MKAQAQTTKIVRQLRSGQVTIPVEFRRELGIEGEGMLQITLADGELRIRPVHATERAADTAWYRQLYDYFAPVRDEIAARGISEQEVNDDIDAAVRAVRAEHA